MKTLKGRAGVAAVLFVTAALVCLTMGPDKLSAQEQPSREEIIRNFTTQMKMLDGMIEHLDTIIQQSQQQKIALVEVRAVVKVRKSDLEEPEMKLRGVVGSSAQKFYKYVNKKLDEAIKKVERDTEATERFLEEQKKRKKETGCY